MGFEVPAELLRRMVGPLEVLDPEQRWPDRRRDLQHLHQMAEDASSDGFRFEPVDLAVARARNGHHPGQVRNELREFRRQETEGRLEFLQAGRRLVGLPDVRKPFEQANQRRERDGLLHFGADALEPAALAARHRFGQELDQPGLPDPGRAGHDHERRAGRPGLLPEVDEPFAVREAPDQLVRPTALNRMPAERRRLRPHPVRRDARDAADLESFHAGGRLREFEEPLHDPAGGIAHPHGVGLGGRLDSFRDVRRFADEPAHEPAVVSRRGPAAAFFDQGSARVNADPHLEIDAVLLFEECRKRFDGGDDVEPRQHGSPGVVFAQARVSEEDQELVAGRLVDVAVVPPHGAGAAAPEPFQRDPPRRVPELAGEPRRAHDVAEHHRHEAQIAAAVERVVWRGLGFQVPADGAEDRARLRGGVRSL